MIVSAPRLPAGATLNSLAIWMRRAIGVSSGQRFFRECYGFAPERAESGNPYGQGAQWLADRMLNGRLSGEELIQRYTLLGLLGPAMGCNWWGNRFRTLIAQGQPTRRLMQGALATKALAWCPDCSEQDVAANGWAPWRVVHQVPFVHHCVWHGTPLLSICRRCACALDQGGGWRLPGDACEVCGSAQFVPAQRVADVPGYRRLLQTILELNAVNAEHSSTDRDNPIKGKSGNTPALRDSVSVLQQLAVEWCVEDPESSIPRLLGVIDRPGFICTGASNFSEASALAVCLMHSLG